MTTPEWVAQSRKDRKGRRKEPWCPLRLGERMLEWLSLKDFRIFPGSPIPPSGSGKMFGFRMIPFPELPWSMRAGSSTFQHLVIMGIKMTGKGSLFKDFLKEEEGDIISRKAAKVAKIILERRG